MSATFVGLGVLLAALWSSAAPAAGQADVQKPYRGATYTVGTNVQQLLPGTSYSVGTNGLLYVSTNIDEMWPGAWKETTNGLRVQLYCWGTDTPEPWVSVSVGSVLFNSGAGLVGPPTGKFARFELRDTNGVVVPPKRGVVMEGQFPARISVKDLPRWPYGDHGLRNPLGFLTNGGPALLREMKLKDVYQVPKEGDYSLTVRAVIYRFEANWDYLDRLDLPTVTTRVHLSP